MPRRRIVLFFLSLVFVLIAATAFLALPAAHAMTARQKAASQPAQHSLAQVTCSGNGCNGLNPATTGCSVGAYTVQTAVFSNSFVELRYSPTCGTNWGRVTSRVGLASLVIRSQRIDGLTYTFAGGNFFYAFSAMVYAPQVAARACGGVGGISGCTAFV